MTTKLHFTKKTINTFFSLLLFCLCFNFAWSQQVIGEFPEMDGGMEAQSATTTMSSAGSSQIGTPQTVWTVSSTGNSSVREMTDDAAQARTGTFSAAWAVLSTATNVRMQSPSPTSPTLQTNTEYTVQFFYKTDTDPGTDLDPGIYLNNTSGGVATDKTDLTAFAADTYIKTYGTVTTGAAFNASNWAVARISTTVGGYNATVRIDDFVVYAGPYDSTAPNDPTDPTYVDNSGTATIGWTAPAGGVDGGGYVVFRYTTMPNADNDPNQNGIYKVGSTTTNGTGSLTGTVAYIGTATSFMEPYVSGTYYKVYAVDKAFNYSNELEISDATLSVAQNKMFDLKLYPNPANNRIVIESQKTPVSNIEIFDVLGKSVTSQTQFSNDIIDISNLSKGLYFLKIYSDKLSITKKIIKE